MRRSRFRSTPKSIAKRIAEGRGQGEGINYRPWFTVRDFPSRGRVHRIRGWKHGRVHHLLSDLEANGFYEYEPPTLVIDRLRLTISDTREQFALFPLEETIEIAREIGVRHPTDPWTKYPCVMTTDLVMTAKWNMTTLYLARSFKYASELDNPRTKEKLEIENIYWGRRPAADWGITREIDICRPLVDNVKLMHPCSRLLDLYPLTLRQVREMALVMTDMVLQGKLPLNLVARRCDEKLGLVTGRSLAVVRYLLANQNWEIDLTRRIKMREPLSLVGFSFDSLI
jgi:hypothetical protein